MKVLNIQGKRNHGMEELKCHDKHADTIHTKNYYTRIKNNDSVTGGGNRYVQGVVMGSMTSVCVDCVDDDFLKYIGRGTQMILVDKQSGDTIYRICTTQERYDMFTSIVEKQYPELCDFDIYD